MSHILSRLKKYPIDIVAVVNVSDDGGSSGIIRNNYKIPAIGDIRRVIVSLADSNAFYDLSEYRFNQGDFKGHTVGNVIILALIKLYGSFNKAILELSKLISIKGKVMPISLDEVELKAQFDDGKIITGETNIVKYNSRIKRLFASGMVNNDVINEIKSADMIIYSCGSLYTSLLSNLVYDDVKKALDESRALKLYVANIMTQNGETTDFTLSMHINTLASYIGLNNIDIVIGNSDLNINDDVINTYLNENSKLVVPDIDEVKKLNVELILDNLIEIENNKIRHNTKRLTAIIMKILLDL